jgi:carboxylesterase
VLRGQEPFELGDSGPGVLLVHGYTGSPFELRPQGEALAAAHYRVRALLLPGHGTTPRDLSRKVWADWYDAVVAEHDAWCRHTGGPVFVVGLSLGSMLALQLACERPDRVPALAALGTPLQPGRHILWGARLFQYSPLRPLLRMPRKRREQDGFDTTLIVQNPSYDAVPMSGLVELVRRLPELRRCLDRIRVPALVAHGTRDTTARVAGGREAFDRLGSEDKQWLELQRSMHLITLDGERDRLCEAVVEFFNRHRGGEGFHA